MGNCEAHSGLTCTSDSGNVALVFRSNGIYGVQQDGSSERVNKEDWNKARLALPTRKGDAITVFHRHGVYRAPMAVTQEEEGTVAYLPMTVNTKVVLLPEGEGMFRVDNSLLQHTGDGLGYRRSKADPPAKLDTVAPAEWGSLVKGQDEGDGWIKVLLSKTKSENISILGKSTWRQAVAAIRSEDEDESLIVFHQDGIFKVNTTDGNHTRVGGRSKDLGQMSFNSPSASWANVRAIVYNPVSPGYAFTFHYSGIFKVKLADGTYEQVSSDHWNNASAAVYDQENEVALVFHSDAIYKVKLTDGTYAALNKGQWTVRGAVNSGAGKALAFCPGGTYSINMTDGVDTKLNDERWASASAICPLGPMAFTTSFFREVQPQVDPALVLLTIPPPAM